MSTTADSRIEVPQTPVGRRVQWILDSVRPEEELAIGAIKEAFTDEYLAAAGPDVIAGWFNDPERMSGSVALSLETPTDFGAVIEMIDGDGETRFRLRVNVEEDEPHRIAMFGVEIIYPAAAGAVVRAWDEVSGGEPVREDRDGPGALDGPLSEDLEAMIAAVREEARFVGLAASIAGPDGLVWFRGFGQARVGGEEVRPDAVFRIGSVSKTITAIGVMQLVENGMVGLDDPINDHLSSYKIEAAAGSDPITIRHLLTHTSGLAGRGGIDTGVVYGQPVPTLPEFYAGGLRAKKPAGAEWIYSNDAFTSLGHLIEELNGKPFHESMQETFFGPLGMRASSYVRGPIQHEGLVTGFSPDRDGFIECVDLDVIIRGAGSVYSTAEDMGRYAACLMNGGAPVLKPETLEEMWSRQFELPQERFKGHMGLGFIVHDVDGRRVPWHNGGWPGAATSMYVAADDGRAVLLTANTFGGQHSQALDQLGMRLTRRLLGLPAS